MIELELVAGDDPKPEPDLTAFGWDGPCGYEVLRDPSLPDDAAEAIWDWLEQEPAARGIPYFKLGNDFWVVTPNEIRSALTQLEGKPVPDVPMWDQWIAVLRRAATARGMQDW